MLSWKEKTEIKSMIKEAGISSKMLDKTVQQSKTYKNIHNLIEEAKATGKFAALMAALGIGGGVAYDIGGAIGRHSTRKNNK